MRESEFRMMMARNAKREMLVLNQWEFLESRQRAFEKVFEGLSLWDRLMILMGRRSLTQLIDSAHLILFQAAQKEREEATKKAKEVMNKPKLILPNSTLNGAVHA